MLKITICFWGFLCLSSQLIAQAGDPDPSWGNSGIITSSTGNFDAKAQALVQQPDGKTIVAGYTQIGSGNYDFALMRFNSDGTKDNSFGTNGNATTDFGMNNADHAYGLALQSDGKILLAGNCVSGATVDYGLARYNSDGTIDNSFGNNGLVATDINGTNDFGVDLAVQSDGKILLLGAYDDSVYDHVAVARYNSDGTMDSSFDSDGIVLFSLGTHDHYPKALKIQSDGKILITGDYYDPASSVQNIFVARYNTDGTLDPSFDSDGWLIADFSNDDDVFCLALQADGKILIGGISQVGATGLIARYSPDGSLDLSFGNNGIFDNASDARIYGIAVQTDGKIVAVGKTVGASYDLLLARLDSTGALDNGFGTNGMVTTDLGWDDEIKACLIQDDGKILVAGSSKEFAAIGYYKFLVGRYLDQEGTFVRYTLPTSPISVYPNPSNGFFEIKLPDSPLPCPFQLSNSLGEVILRGRFDSPQSSLDLQTLEAGTYFLSIEGAPSSKLTKY